MENILPFALKEVFHSYLLPSHEVETLKIFYWVVGGLHASSSQQLIVQHSRLSARLTRVSHPSVRWSPAEIGAGQKHKTFLD